MARQSSQVISIKSLDYLLLLLARDCPFLLLSSFCIPVPISRIGNIFLAYLTNVNPLPTLTRTSRAHLCNENRIRDYSLDSPVAYFYTAGGHPFLLYNLDSIRCYTRRDTVFLFLSFFFFQRETAVNNQRSVAYYLNTEPPPPPCWLFLYFRNWLAVQRQVDSLSSSCCRDFCLRVSRCLVCTGKTGCVHPSSHGNFLQAASDLQIGRSFDASRVTFVPRACCQFFLRRFEDFFFFHPSCSSFRFLLLRADFTRAIFVTRQNQLRSMLLFVHSRN